VEIEEYRLRGVIEHEFGRLLDQAASENMLREVFASTLQPFVLVDRENFPKCLADAVVDNLGLGAESGSTNS
jgi:hypothetical protein